MKITVICHDVPYPAIHGGRVDMWHRIKALAKLDVEIQLICWHKEALLAKDIQVINEYVDSFHHIQYESGVFALLFKLWSLRKFPLEIASRIIFGKKLEYIISQVEKFQPDIIWLDGIHGGELAKTLAQKLNIPLVTRCHNIEHIYNQKLYASATGMGKLKKYLSTLHLEEYEKNILRISHQFYDISNDDLQFWQQQGFHNGNYLPPILDVSSEHDVSDINNSLIPSEYDIIFMGNLYTHNNVAGVSWFLSEVLPIVRKTLPDIKVLIAGSKPTATILEICNQVKVSLKINPISTTEIYNSGNIFINPVLTGSGVSIKSIEMLSYGKPIISTNQGIAGLPTELKQYFTVANNAIDFADKILYHYNNLSVQKLNIEPKVISEYLGIEVIKQLLSNLP